MNQYEKNGVNMQTNIVKPNATIIADKSFKSILEEMMKLTTGGNIKVANKNWDIFKAPTNNINYNNPIGA